MVIDAVRDAIVVLDARGRIELWNARATQLLGYAGAELLGKPIEMLYPVDDPTAPPLERLFADARDRGCTETVVWQIKKDTTRFLANLVVRAVPPEEGADRRYVLVTRDLTERRRASDERSQEDNKFRVLVENARDYAIFMLDTTGHIASWNEGAQRIKGYSAREIIGQHFSKFYLDEESRTGKCERELETAMREGRFEEEGWRVRKDGTRFWANVMIAPLRDDRGTHLGFSKITHDLTERRAAELDRLSLARAQEALRLRDEFLSIASHELRTPLVALQLQLDSLSIQAATLEPKQRAKVERARRNATRLADLITTLLDVSRIAEGRLTLDLCEVDLGELVHEVVDRLEESASVANNVVAVAGDSDLLGLWDPLRIGQVVSNVLANSFKYAAGTQVEIDLRHDGNDAVLRVEDRGPGIAEHKLDRIFDRFERAASARNYPGMGLGLYVARQIVVAHGGSIRARNGETGGAVVEVRLPLRTPTKDLST
ncbi:MAG TPA: PAS domain S-box protein [Kofleriaceae bacterium]|nr:PAS domain S-box protein [Kofleriaceae bacterium]